MFEFEKLSIYQKAKNYNVVIQKVINNPDLKRHQRDQVSRASMSILLNIAEGCERFTKPSKRNFYTLARGSVFECVAILDILTAKGIILKNDYQSFYSDLDELSRILFSLIRKLE